MSAPIITSSLTPLSFTLGAAISNYTITASGTPTSFDSKNLPTGLTLNTSTGVISGTPTTAGVYNSIIVAENSSGNDYGLLIMTVSLGNNAVIKGDTTVLWGTAGGTTITGIIVSVRDTLTGEMVEVPDNNGYSVAAVFFNDKNEGEVEIVVQTSAPTLKRGDNTTIMGVSGYLVTEVEKMWEQKNVRKYRFKATKFSGMTL